MDAAEARDRAEDRRFAGAVCADQRVGLAFLHGERNALQREKEALKKCINMEKMPVHGVEILMYC